MDSMLKATHEGKLNIGETELNVAVLEDGSRIITQSAVFRAFGRTKRGRAKTDIRVLNRPAFVDAKNLQPLISLDLDEVLNVVEYFDLKGKKSEGYKADILPLLCKLYLDARQQSVLVKSQLPLARASEILLVSLSKVGIIALVDEATGYQYDREKDALQKILKAYISEELLPWQKRFPDIFYKELFRLNGWDFTVSGIKKRPGVVGKWTNTLIYNQLPKGVNEELRSSTPKNNKGKFTARLHQSLTTDVGHPHLSAQINQVLAIFTLSDNMKEMWQNFKKMNDRKNGVIELPFEFDDKGSTIPIDPPIKEQELSEFDKNLSKALNYNPKE